MTDTKLWCSLTTSLMFLLHPEVCFTFLIDIHAMQGWGASKRYRVKRKRRTWLNTCEESGFKLAMCWLPFTVH